MRKTFYYGLFCLMIFNGLLFASTTTDPNKAVSIAVQPQPQNSSSVSGQQQSLDYQQKLVEEKLNAVEKRTGDLKWIITTSLSCMGFVITLMAAFIALIAIKSGREYKEAVDKAEKSADKAHELEREAQRKCETIDERINAKITEFDKRADNKFNEIDSKIEELGDKVTKRVIVESEKQRELSDRYNSATKAITKKDYELACNLLSGILEDYPDDPIVRKALGVTFMYQGTSKNGEERERLYQKAEDIFLKAERVKKGSDAYNLGCLYALRGDQVKCQEWLKVGEEAGTLVTREMAMKDDDLASVRDKDWFKTIHWKGEQ